MPQLCHSCRALASTAMPKNASPPPHADDAEEEDGQASSAAPKPKKRRRGEKTYDEYVAELEPLHRKKTQLNQASKYISGLCEKTRLDESLANNKAVKKYVLDELCSAADGLLDRDTELDDQCDAIFALVETYLGEDELNRMEIHLAHFKDDVIDNPEDHDSDISASESDRD